MKNTILFTLLTMTTITMSCAQKTEKEAIIQTIETFSKAGDNNDVAALSEVLDDNYRIVMNRMFGCSEVSIMPKSVYLDKIKSKEFGGDTRDLTIGNVVVNGNTASAKVTFKGTKTIFISILVLVKDTSNQWFLVSDVPVMI